MRYTVCIIRSIAQKIRSVVGGRVFFWITLVFFVMQSSWIALSAQYPQAFDEQFHLGIIQVYARHWLPFLKSQPSGANPYGAVTRDPSFFYHYAMSFPYRIIELFAHSQVVQVVDLRFIDIALFACGIILFRKVLQRVGLSNLAVNLSIFILTFVPVAPQLAGQINYDNLLIPMAAWACLLTFNVIDQLEQRELRLQTLMLLLCVCLLASMVKYEFLPIFLGISGFLFVFAWRRLHGYWRTAWRDSVTTWRAGSWRKWLVLVGLCVALTLFAQRDIGNVLIYHTVVPDCSQVLKFQQCSAYGVWVHDYNAHQAVVGHTTHVDPNPFGYILEWTYWLWYRLFFAINGADSGFVNYPPLPLPAAMFGALVALGTVALAVRGRRTFAGKPYRAALGIIVVVYLLTLFGAGYEKFLDTGILELMNGRYLFPIFLPAAAITIPAVTAWLHGLPAIVRSLFVVLIIACFLQGGGVFTFIVRSNYTWYWKDPTVVRANYDARRVLDPLLVDGPHTYGTQRWLFN